MRIAYISYEYPPDTAFGGIGTYVYSVSKLMASRGHKVSVFTAAVTENTSYIEDNVQIHRVRELNRHDFGISIANIFFKEHSKKPFDVIEGPDFSADARKISAENPEVPYVLCMHTPSKLSAQLNTFVNYRHEVKKIYSDARKIILHLAGKKVDLNSLQSTLKKTYLSKQNRIEKREAIKADLVISPSMDLCDFARNTWKITQEKIQLSPYPFIPGKNLLEIPIGSNKSKKELVIGYLGRMQYRKGISFFTEAIPRVLKKFPEMKFRFVGSIKNEPITDLPYDEWIKIKLKDFIKNVDVKGSVPFNKIADELALMDIVVLPSVWENFPNACLEAMSAGRAVIGSKNGGMAEMLNEGECGHLVNPKNTDELVRKISDLIENPGKRKEFGEKARQRILEEYNGEVIGKHKEKLYREAARRKKNGRVSP